jgi:hypothetical protein
MNLKAPKDSNYAVVVVEIKTLIPLENCDNVQATPIMGQQVIIGKDVKVGDIGLYFPVESQLSKEFLSNNNLYREKSLNVDTEKSGYFDENGRIRCQKFRGHNSEGLFMPINSIEFTGINPSELKIADEFDELNGIEISKKYVVKASKTHGTHVSPKSRTMNNKMRDKLVENQFKFHKDTLILGKNTHKIKPDTLIHLSYKEHGSSNICSNVLVKKKLKWYEKALIKLGVDIPTTEYGYIYSSGKPKSNLPKGIVGKYVNENGDYYSDDIWKESFEYLKDFLTPGLSIYSEIVGYTKTGGAIQSSFDYGCVPPKSGEKYTCGINYKIKVYRITYTSVDGKTFEFSPIQVQEWCKNMGIEPVHQLFYGYAKDLFKLHKKRVPAEIDFGDKFMELLKEFYNDKDCFMCSNKVPEEGVVIRIDGLNFEAYKQKSSRFLSYETKQLDKGEVNIEDEA